VSDPEIARGRLEAIFTSVHCTNTGSVHTLQNLEIRQFAVYVFGGVVWEEVCAGEDEALDAQSEIVDDAPGGEFGDEAGEDAGDEDAMEEEAERTTEMAEARRAGLERSDRDMYILRIS